MEILILIIAGYLAKRHNDRLQKEEKRLEQFMSSSLNKEVPEEYRNYDFIRE